MVKKDFGKLQDWVKSRNGKIFVDEENSLVKVSVLLKEGETLVKTYTGEKGNVVAKSRETTKIVVFPDGVEVAPKRLIAVRIVKELSNCIIAIPLLYQDYFVLEEGEYEGFLVRIRWNVPYAL